MCWARSNDTYDALLKHLSFNLQLSTVIDTRADMEAMGFTEEEILYELAKENTNRQASAVPQAEKPAAAGSVEANQGRAEQARPRDGANTTAAKQADERTSATRAKDGQQSENRGSNTGSAGKTEKVVPKQTVVAKLKSARKAKKAEIEKKLKPKPKPVAKADKVPKA